MAILRPIFRLKSAHFTFLGAEEVSAEASLETVFGQNVILSLLFDWYGSEIAI